MPDYYFSPLPYYTEYNADNPDRNLEHWHTLWNVPISALRFYHYFLSKLQPDGTSLPIKDEELAELTNISVRQAARMRTDCERAGLIEKDREHPGRKGTHVYRLPYNIKTQNLANSTESGNYVKHEKWQIAQNMANSKNTESGKYHQKWQIENTKSGNYKSEQKPPETQSGSDSEPVGTESAFLDLKALDLKTSLAGLNIVEETFIAIRDVFVANWELHENKRAGDATIERIGKELQIKLQEIINATPDIEPVDVLLVIEKLAKEGYWRSPGIFAQQGVMEDIFYRLESSIQDTPKTRSSDKVFRNKTNVPEEVVMRWIDSKVEERHCELEYNEDGRLEPVFSELTNDQKEKKREELLKQHENGTLDYQYIHDWNDGKYDRKEYKPRPKVEKQKLPPSRPVTVSQQIRQEREELSEGEGRTQTMGDAVTGFLDNLGITKEDK